MPESPRAPQRNANRLNRPHAGQSLDPTLTRKGVLAHPGSLSIGVAALGFFAYVFDLGGLQTYLDGLFGGLDKTARSHDSEVATTVIAALPYLGVALGALVLFLVFMLLSRGAKSVSKKRKLGSREKVSLHDFTAAAAVHGIGARVAREAYHLLLPHYHNEMRVTLSDRFVTTLHMKPVEVSDLYGNLMRRTDRQRKVGDDGTRLETVLDLILAVEDAIPRSLTQSKMHQRAEREANKPVRKRPSMAEKIKQSILRSAVRPASASAANLAATLAARKKNPSVIKPFRPAVREAELGVKPPLPPNGESPAAN